MSDTLATLRQALSPKTGMRRIPIPLESYEHPSLPLSAKRLVNLFAEKMPGDARSEWALVSTPGLFPNGMTFGTGPVWAINSDLPGTNYVVSGTRFYRQTLAAGGAVVIEDLGDVGWVGTDDFAYNLMITVAVGVIAAVVCVPPRAYVCSHTEATVHLIGGDFPGARSVTYLDGYFVFTSTELNSKFFLTKLLDAGAYNALDFAFADVVPNVIRRALTLRGDIWLGGEGGIEVWNNTGDLDFPLRRVPGAHIEFGVATPKSMTIADGSLFWVSTDGVVMRSNGYKAVRVSTHAIEHIIRLAGAPNVSYALDYTQNGHTFYAVTYGARTLVYDCATERWHERSSSVDGASSWRIISATRVGSTTFMGDQFTGRLMVPVPGLPGDDGVAVIRQAVLPPIGDTGNRLFMNRVEVEMEAGGPSPAGNVLMEKSDDGGWSWDGPRTMNAGSATERRKRVFITRYGSFHQRALRITTHGLTCIFAVDADITAPHEAG